ncbi:MAG TPA: transcription antitermination factor NusB [Gemmataceae bacterium]|nr:transcription antitermination factor NusB [Gemmataceae bacterium]
MTNRSRAREVALQLLFQRDHNPGVDPKAIERFIQDRLSDPGLQTFCRSLFDGVVGHAAEIDERLTQAAENWRLPRMAGVDRNVLRLGAFELLFSSETPAGVALNEAIELARRFGSADSPGFVNGVLDQIRRSLEPPTTDHTDDTDKKEPKSV